MKRGLIIIIGLIIILSGQTFAFERQSQCEFFGGFAIPLAPDEFKDYYKIGLSPHAQFVIFPSPNIGISFGAAYEFFTFDDSKFFEEFEALYGYDARDYGVEVKGNAKILEFGIGLRPYLTPATSNAQFFLFGMGTFNIVSNTIEIYYNDPLIEDDKLEDDENKFGVAVGAGLEVPAGNVNIILQGLTRFIFTEGDATSFIGITTGIVF